jgi:hypothetical protein
MIKQAIGMLVLGSVFASGVASALMIDQKQEDISEPLQSGVNNVSAKLQGFTPTATNVAGGGFHFGLIAASPVDMTIALWDGLPGIGTLIASSTVKLSAVGWLDAFWTPVSVTPNATYYLAISTGGIGTGALEPAVSSDKNQALYVNGGSYAFNPTNNAFENSGEPYSGFDFAFRTYFAEAPSPVPLPAAAWLMLSGLAGLGVLGRRRKAA